LQWTPSPRDAKRYNIDGPQIFDIDALDDLPSSELESLEREIRARAGVLLSDLWPPRDNSVPLARAVMWVTLRLRGSDLAWEDFDPQVRRTNFAAEGGDVDPPAGTSSPEESDSSG
jgi:hypothetical protein